MLLETITFILVGVLSFILMLYLLHKEPKLQRYPMTFSLMIYVLISLNQIMPLVRWQSRHLAIIEYGSFVMFNIVAVYSILPLKKRMTIALGVLSSSINIVFISLFLFNSNLDYSVICKKVRTRINIKLYIFFYLKQILYFNRSWHVMQLFMLRLICSAFIIKI